MLGLLDQLETENPEDISLAPKVGLVDVIDTVTRTIQRAAQCYSCCCKVIQPVPSADIWRMGQCICEICPDFQEAREGIRPGSSSTEKEGHESGPGGLYGSSTGSQSLVGTQLEMLMCCKAVPCSFLGSRRSGATHTHTHRSSLTEVWTSLAWMMSL